MNYEQKTQSLMNNPKSVFVSHARNEDRQFIGSLMDWLHKNNYEAVSCDCPESQWNKMIGAAMACRNIILVSTEKYVYTSLIGKVKSDKFYAKYPSLAFSSITQNIDRSNPRIEMAFKISAVIFGAFSEAELPPEKLRFICDAVTSDKMGIGDVRYYFSDDYCLEESQLIIRNEKRFERIVTLYRSGNDCICRYPIIDCSKSAESENYFKELDLYLKSEPSQRLKNLERPQILRVVSSANKGKSSLQNVTFWRLSDQYLFAMIPSLHQGEFKGTLNTLLRDWISLRR